MMERTEEEAVEVFTYHYPVPDDVSDEAVYDFLNSNSVANSVVLGVLPMFFARKLGSQEKESEVSVYIAFSGKQAKTSQREVVGVFIVTPPRSLLLGFPAREHVLKKLALHLIQTSDLPPGVTGKKEDVEAFVRILEEVGGKKLKTMSGKQSIFHVIKQVNWDNVKPAAGSLVPFSPDSQLQNEMALLWIKEFNRYINKGHPFLAEEEIINKMSEDTILQCQKNNSLYFWQLPVEEGGDEKESYVSMGMVKEVPVNGGRISMVYTPPQHRGHNYATNCVAHLSEMLLKSKDVVAIATDASEVVPNKIYARIGYDSQVRWNDILFEPS